MDSSIFAAQFSELFKDFVDQQQKFQQRVEKTFISIEKTLSKSIPSVTQKYENENQKRYLHGRPTNVQKTPRKVKEDSIRVVIDDISKKAADKLDGDDTTTIKTINNQSSGGLLEKVLGGLLLGVTAVAGGFAARQLGIDTSALSTVFGVAGKFSKLLRKLPLVGLLISTGEALSKFKEGGPKNIISGMMDIVAGISYMFPGIGTAIGLGVDVLNYFFEKTIDEAETEGKKVETFGDIYRIIKDAILNSPVGKWFTQLGEKWLAVFKNPGVDTLYDYFEHIGLVWLGDMFNKFDQGVGNLLGLTNEAGEMTSLTDWMSSWVADNIVTPIINFFDYVGEQIAAAIRFVKNFGEEMINEVKQTIEDNSPSAIAEEFYGVRASDEILEGDALVSSGENYRKLFGRLKEQYEYTVDQINELTKDVPDEMPQVKARILGAEIRKLQKHKQNNLEEQQPGKPPETIISEEELQEWLKNNPNTDNPDIKEMNDFSIFDNKLNGIVMGDKYQPFNKDDSIIGFKDGEALVKGLESLISIGKEQIQLLQTYLEENKQSIIAAPSTNTTNNMTFTVESGVSAFRKALS